MSSLLLLLSSLLLVIHRASIILLVDATDGNHQNSTTLSSSSLLHPNISLQLVNESARQNTHSIKGCHLLEKFHQQEVICIAPGVSSHIQRISTFPLAVIAVSEHELDTLFAENLIVDESRNKAYVLGLSHVPNTIFRDGRIIQYNLQTLSSNSIFINLVPSSNTNNDRFAFSANANIVSATIEDRLNAYETRVFFINSASTSERRIICVKTDDSKNDLTFCDDTRRTFTPIVRNFTSLDTELVYPNGIAVISQSGSNLSLVLTSSVSNRLPRDFWFKVDVTIGRTLFVYQQNNQNLFNTSYVHLQTAKDAADLGGQLEPCLMPYSISIKNNQSSSSLSSKFLLSSIMAGVNEMIIFKFEIIPTLFVAASLSSSSIISSSFLSSRGRIGVGTSLTVTAFQLPASLDSSLFVFVGSHHIAFVNVSDDGAFSETARTPLHSTPQSLPGVKLISFALPVAIYAAAATDTGYLFMWNLNLKLYFMCGATMINSTSKNEDYWNNYEKYCRNGDGTVAPSEAGGDSPSKNNDGQTTPPASSSTPTYVIVIYVVGAVVILASVTSIVYLRIRDKKTRDELEKLEDTLLKWSTGEASSLPSSSPPPSSTAVISEASSSSAAAVELQPRGKRQTSSPGNDQELIEQVIYMNKNNHHVVSNNSSFNNDNHGNHMNRREDRGRSVSSGRNEDEVNVNDTDDEEVTLPAQVSFGANPLSDA